MQGGFAAAILSVMMIATFALAAGGVWLIVRRGDARKGLLMLIAALVLLGNVLIQTV